MSEGAQLLKDMILEMKELNKKLEIIIRNQMELENSLRGEFHSLSNGLTDIDRNSSDMSMELEYLALRSQDYD